MERSKHPIGQPKLQRQMTLQSLGKHINQESEEGTSNQESKNREEVLTLNGLHHTFGLTFRLQCKGIGV